MGKGLAMAAGGSDLDFSTHKKAVCQNVPVISKLRVWRQTDPKVSLASSLTEIASFRSQ